MKKTVYFVALGLVLMSAQSLALTPQEIDARLLTMIQENIDNPWPGISDPNNAPGVFSYALACLYLDQNVEQANDLIVNFYTNNPIPEKTSSARDDYNGYFWQHIMWRLYHDTAMNARLTSQARTIIEDNMWTWLDTRSKRTEAQQNEWIIHDSENHDAMQKGSHLLCLVALKNAPGYGPDMVLADGGTITEHADAWTAFYMRYFRARAMEGINVEIACPQYAKYTVGAYYNIMDFSDSPELRALAKTFMDLYWADTASDWTRSGVRGGGQTRVYREGNYLRLGTTYSFHALLYGYGWHGNASTVRTYPMIPAVSSYRVPDIITACATDTNRPNFLYRSRRFGRGGNWSSNRDYTVVFDNGNSNLRRDTWVTPDYTIGTFTVDMSRDYIALIDQNRLMGVTFASGVNDRIMVFGEGGSDPSKSFADINGVTRENCMIVQRDENVYSGGDDTMLFLSSSSWNNRVETSGWLFTQLGNAYCAIKPANGGYTAASTAYGYNLELDDAWAPVVIQMGQASDYAGFADFRASVITNALSYEDGWILNYTSEAGDTFTVYAASSITPEVNGTTVNLNPVNTYDSPYLSMTHGEAVATVSYGGYPDLVLDFGTNAPPPPPPPDDLNDWDAPAAAVVPSIDGTLDLGEWGDAFKLEIKYPEITQFPNVGGQKYDEPSVADFSGNIFYKWDADYLYIAFDITDDVFIAPAPGTGYPDDHVLFGFNPDITNTVWADTLSVEFFENTLGQADATIRQDRSGALSLASLVMATTNHASGWEFEARLKWSEITGDPGYVPTAGDTFGTAVLMVDNDAHDGVRDTFLYSAGEGDTAVMTTPALWHEVTLSGARHTYDYWISGYDSVGMYTNRSDNPDGDELNNEGEYFFGGHPGTNDAYAVLPFYTFDPALGTFTCTYNRRIGAAALGIDYTVETSPTLSEPAWSTNGVTEAECTPVSEEIEQVIVTMPMNTPEKFIHLDVRQQ